MCVCVCVCGVSGRFSRCVLRTPPNPRHEGGGLFDAAWEDPDSPLSCLVGTLSDISKLVHLVKVCVPVCVSACARVCIYVCVPYPFWPQHLSFCLTDSST